jgi:hypothetical protein
MPKLRLDIDDLAVESFLTVPETPARGTVAGAESGYAATVYDGGCSTHETACPEESCVANSQCCASKDPTCLFTCEQTCTGWRSAACYHTEVC